MKAIVIVLSIVFVAALLNMESISSITLTLVSIYMVYELLSRRRSVADLPNESNALITRAPVTDNSAKRGEAVDNLMKDFGKVTACVIEGKPVDLSGEAIMKSSQRAATDAKTFVKS